MQENRVLKLNEKIHENLVSPPNFKANNFA